MSSKGKLIHKQQFQNAQQIIEVTIKSKPKAKLGLKTKGRLKDKPFVRDCLLKQEVEKLIKEKEEKKQRIRKLKTGNQERPMPKLKINQPKMTVEVFKKKNEIKNTNNSSFQKGLKNGKALKRSDVLPPDMSWGEFLKSLSSTKSSSSGCSDCNNDTTTANNDNHYLDSSSNITNKKVNEFKNKEPDIPIRINKNFSINLDQCKLKEKISPYNPPSKKVDKYIQTSFEGVQNNSVSMNPSSSVKTISKSVKNSTSQTHSPFGESALKLLQHLKERLQSLGDNEGSDIVCALESYFGSADKKSENRNAPKEGSSASPLFTPVFQFSTQTPKDDKEKEKLKRVITEQKKRLEEQEQSIEELKSLSMKLIAYNEQLSQHLIRETQNVENESEKNIGSTSESLKKKEMDEVDHNGSEDLLKTIKHLTSERDALLKETKDQREVILNLEIRLNQFQTIYEENFSDHNQRRKHNRQQPVHGYDSRKPFKKTGVQTSRERESINATSAHLLRHTDNDSEVDSAYEEKSSRSSHPSSKISQPIPRNVSPNIEEFSLKTRTKSPEPHKMTKFKNDCNFKPLPNFYPRNNPLPNCTNSELKVNPNYSKKMVDVEGISSYKVEVMKNDTHLLIPNSNLSSSMISDVSSDRQVHSLTVEGSYRNRKSDNLNGISLSETPLSVPPQRFLESTHMNSKPKAPLLHSEETLLRRKEFDPGFSTLESTSPEGTRFLLNSMLQSCSNSD